MTLLELMDAWLEGAEERAARAHHVASCECDDDPCRLTPAAVADIWHEEWLAELRSLREILRTERGPTR